MLRRMKLTLAGCIAFGVFATGACAAQVHDDDIFGINPALLGNLQASASPRDWALAADAIQQVDTIGGTGTRSAESAALLAKAVAAAPDDTFVQWLALAYAKPPTADGARRLAASDPGNAAVWLASLDVAAAANDAAGIEVALAGMAAAQRYDEHFRDYLLAWVEIYRRGSTRDDRLDAYTNAVARAAALAVPPYRPLIVACDAQKNPALVASRIDVCETIARQMTGGPTFIVQGIGHAILRRSSRATPADAEAERTMRWQMQQSAPAGADQDMAKQLQQMIADWTEAGTEAEVAQRRLVRAGIALTPPADWDWRETKR
jgi:hypothetical protein